MGGVLPPGTNNGLGNIVGTSMSPSGVPAPTNYNILAAAVNPKQTIWNIPNELNGYQIWYDNRYSKEAYDPTTESRNRAANNPTTSTRFMTDPESVLKLIAATEFNKPSDFLAIQNMLSSGAWGHVALTGHFDTATQDALKAAMVQYAQATNGLHGSDGAAVPISFKDYLLKVSSTVAANKAATNAANGPTIHLADPAQIRDAAQTAATEALGHGLTEQQLETFINKFQYEQMTANTDAYTQSLKLPGEAMQFAQNADPADYHANQRQTFENALINMFAPANSQRPNMNPTPSLS